MKKNFSTETTKNMRSFPNTNDKSMNFHLSKFYSNNKQNHRVSQSLNFQITNFNSARIDNTINQKIDELANLSKMFSDRMRIIDIKTIKEINTSENWKKLNFSSSSLMKLMSSKNNKKKLQFSFSDFQKEFEKNWLDSLKRIKSEGQVKIANILMNGGYEDKEISNCSYLIENEVKRLEEKAVLAQKKISRNRKKLHKTLTNFTKRSLITDLEAKNSNINEYCNCRVSHKLNQKCPQNYTSLIYRSRPISAEKFIQGLREKLNLKNTIKLEKNHQINEEISPRYEVISFLNTERDNILREKSIKQKEKYPLPSITYLENLYRTKWNKTKPLNTKSLYVISKKNKRTLDDIIKESEKNRLKQMARKIGYNSKTVLKSQKPK